MEGIDPNQEVLSDLTGVVKGAQEEWLPSDEVAQKAALVIVALMQREVMDVLQRDQAMHASGSRLSRKKIEEISQALIKLEEKLEENKHTRSLWSQIGTGTNLALAVTHSLVGATLLSTGNIPLGAMFLFDGLAKAGSAVADVSGAYEKAAEKILPEGERDEQYQLASRMRNTANLALMVTSIGLTIIGWGAVGEASAWLSNVQKTSQTFANVGQSYAGYKNGVAQANGLTLQGDWSDTESDLAKERGHMGVLTEEFGRSSNALGSAAKNTMDKTSYKITKTIVSAS